MTGTWKIMRAVTIISLFCLNSNNIWAQQNYESKDSQIDETAPEKSPFPLPDYSGDVHDRKYFAGDWRGARNELAQKGLTFDIGSTLIFQGNARGGTSTNNAVKFGGSNDYWLRADMQRMGIWPAGIWTIHAETAFGESANSDAGSIMPVNYDALLPLPNRNLTTLSEAYLTQFISRQLAIVVGKVDGTILLDKNEFANSERTQFLNAALRNNLLVAPFAPYTAQTVALIYQPSDWLTVTTAALDGNGTVTRSGFNTAFSSPQGTTFVQEWEVKVEPYSLKGNQRIGIGYSNKNFSNLEADPRISFQVPGPAPGNIDRRPDDWFFYYNFNQYIYVDRDNPERGVGLFGRFGYSSGKGNPIQRFYSIGVGGHGIMKDRQQDSFGIGYYHTDLSDDLPKSLNLSSEQGIEIFYNIAITKSMQITPDLQWIINPGAGFDGRGNAVVFGIRSQMNF